MLCVNYISKQEENTKKGEKKFKGQRKGDMYMQLYAYRYLDT